MTAGTGRAASASLAAVATVAVVMVVMAAVVDRDTSLAVTPNRQTEVTRAGFESAVASEGVAAVTGVAAAVVVAPAAVGVVVAAVATAAVGVVTSATAATSGWTRPVAVVARGRGSPTPLRRAPSRASSSSATVAGVSVLRASYAVAMPVW